MDRGLVSSIRKLRARFHGEAGFALPFALLTTFVTGTLATSAIAYSSSNYGAAKRSDAESQALALAEAGLNYAYSTLYNSGTPTMANAVPSRTITLETGDATYYGTLTGTLEARRDRHGAQPDPARQSPRRADGERQGHARVRPSGDREQRRLELRLRRRPDRDDDARQLGRREHPVLRARQPRADEHARRSRATRSRSAARSSSTTRRTSAPQTRRSTRPTSAAAAGWVTRAPS